MVDTRRVRYYQGQYLGAADFEAEQDYHRAMRRRHNLGPHTWGIVAGLQLEEVAPAGAPPNAVDVFLRPGMAIDGLGRELFVFETLQLDPLDLQRQNIVAGTQPVWLAYDEQESVPPRYGYEICDPDGQWRRIFEQYRLLFGPQDPNETDHTVVKADPVTVDGASASVGWSVPHQDLPDGDTQRWLIRVGSVEWNATDQRFETTTELDAGRRFAGSVAATIYGPDGEVRLRDRRADVTGAAADLEVVVEGELRVEDLVTAEDDVQLHGGAIELRDTTGAEDATGTPLQPAVGIQRLDPGGGGGVDLALDLGDGDQGDHRLAIRSDGTDRVTVADDGTTVIDGSLTVDGDNDLVVDGGTVGITRAGASPPNWRVGATPAGDGPTPNLEFRENIAEADPDGRLVFELLNTAGNLPDPVLRLMDDNAATLSAEQLIDLTDGGETILHTHPHASTIAAGLVEIAFSTETASTGTSGAPLVVAADDTRLLTPTQRTDLTDGGLTTLHRHNSPLLGNVSTAYLHADGIIDLETVSLPGPTPKRVVAFIIPNRFELEGGLFGGAVSPVYATVSAVTGGSLTTILESVYVGNASSVTFKLECLSGHADATALVIWEDL